MVVSIDNFHGSVVLNTQPIKLSEVYLHDDWDAVAVNKILRFYHLRRPTKSNPTDITAKINWGIDIDRVRRPSEAGAVWLNLMRLGIIQWDVGRAHEHLSWLLRAAAALDGRDAVKPIDVKIVKRVLLSARVELAVMDRIGFSSGKLFKSDVLELITELATYERVTLGQLCRDFKMKPTRISERLQSLGEYFVTVDFTPKTIAASTSLKELLKGAYF